MWIEVDNVSQRYGDEPVLDGLSFRLERGAIGCLLGPSGCGKTTALRCVAGFEPVRSGRIVANEKTISAPDLTVPPERRHMGMVFQEHALFPHLSVLDNVSFGLTGLGKAERVRRVTDLLEVVGLAELADAWPHELSGGQRQRVAVARALAPRPRLLLMDEPFSSLDSSLRLRLGVEVRDILKALSTTALLVTHDQNEAFAMADDVGVMRRGRIEQWAAPYDLYHRPASRFVADFVGDGSFLPGEVVDGSAVRIELGRLPGRTIHPLPAGTAVDVLLRPDDIRHEPEGPLEATVLRKAFRGADILFTLGLPSGHEVLALVPSHDDHEVGDRLPIRLATDHVVAFPRSTG